MNVIDKIDSFFKEMYKLDQGKLIDERNMDAKELPTLEILTIMKMVGILQKFFVKN